MNWLFRRGVWCLVLASLLVGIGRLSAQEAPAPQSPTLSPKDQQEVEMGKRIVAEIEKEYRFITDPAERGQGGRGSSPPLSACGEGGRGERFKSPPLCLRSGGQGGRGSLKTPLPPSPSPDKGTSLEFKTCRHAPTLMPVR